MVRRQAAVLIGAAIALIACWLLAPLFPTPSTLTAFRIGTYGWAIVFFAVLGLFVALGAHIARSARTGTLITLAVIMFVVAMAANIADVPIISDLAKIAFAVAIAAAVIRPIERAWWLLPLTLCVPLADIWSVFSTHGVTHAVISKAAKQPRWIDWPTIAVPIPGLSYHAAGRMGTTDVFFLALLVAAALRWRLGVRRIAIVLPLTFVAAIVVVDEWADRAIPALPLLCIAFAVLAFPGMWRDLRADLATRH